jgi:hypothetical protein
MAETKITTEKIAAQEAGEQWSMGQAYQVIAALASVTGTFETPEVQAALDYFASGKYRDDWEWTPPQPQHSK